MCLIKGAVGSGEPLELCASQGTPCANPERVSFLTQLVKVRPLENVKGEGEESRQLASSSVPLSPRGTRGHQSCWGLKVHGWAWSRRNMDLEAGPVLLGRARVKAPSHVGRATWNPG